MMKWTGSALLGTRRYNFQPLHWPWVPQYSVTDRQTDRQTDDNIIPRGDHTAAWLAKCCKACCSEPILDSMSIITMCTLTRAPMTPRLVSRKYSNGRVLLTVWRNGYRNRGMWAAETHNPHYINISILPHNVYGNAEVTSFQKVRLRYLLKCNHQRLKW